MQAKCALCDQVDYIDDNSYKAKHLKNSRIQSYLCNECYERIEKRTMERKKTGKFKLYESHSKNGH